MTLRVTRNTRTGRDRSTDHVTRSRKPTPGPSRDSASDPRPRSRGRRRRPPDRALSRRCPLALRLAARPTTSRTPLRRVPRLRRMQLSRTQDPWVRCLGRQGPNDAPTAPSPDRDHTGQRILTPDHQRDPGVASLSIRRFFPRRTLARRGDCRRGLVSLLLPGGRFRPAIAEDGHSRFGPSSDHPRSSGVSEISPTLRQRSRHGPTDLRHSITQCIAAPRRRVVRGRNGEPQS